jgi:uncharacterized protein (DUF885 family)
MLEQPGGFVVYLIGYNKIMELRRLAERELGSRFEIRSFHDQVLRNDNVPLDVLDAQIRDWIRSTKR